MYTADGYRTSIDLITCGAVDAETIVTATFPLEEAGRAFVTSLRPEHVKVLITLAAA
ncbi:hypothetical protein [Streptomyces sp. NPDC014734]|uniref:hypothetical protein n=1 Tax=Streptomyces sp. NPDC014734 TaxID=3364886 RepID=UPI0036FF7152